MGDDADHGRPKGLEDESKRWQRKCPTVHESRQSDYGGEEADGKCMVTRNLVNETILGILAFKMDFMCSAADRVNTSVMCHVSIQSIGLLQNHDPSINLHHRYYRFPNHCCIGTATATNRRNHLRVRSRLYPSSLQMD